MAAPVVRGNPGLLRGVMREGVARPTRLGLHERMAMFGGGGRVQGGAVRGKAAARNPVDAGFGDENQRGSFHYIGPFSWGGHLTPQAQAARGAHSAAQAKLAKFYSDVQSNFANSGSVHVAFTSALKSNPGIAGTAARLGISPVQLLQQAQRAPTIQDNQVSQLPGGLTLIRTPEGKTMIARQEQPRAVPAGKIVKTSTGYGYQDPAHPGVLLPMTGPHGETVAGPPPKAPAPPKPPTPKEENAGDQRLIGAYQTIMQTLDTIKATVGSTGSFGWGAANRLVAMHTPLSGPQGEAYNAAYNTLKEAALATAGSTRLKAVYEAALGTLPSPTDATAFLVNQQIPLLGMQTRNKIAALDQQLHHAGVYDTSTIDALARNYNAGPALMQQVNNGLAMLAHSPGQMTNQQLAPLVYMMKDGSLPQDQGERVLRQMYQRKAIPLPQWQQLTQDYPDLNQISPEEHTNPQFIPATPGAAPGSSPGTAAGAPAPGTPGTATVAPPTGMPAAPKQPLPGPQENPQGAPGLPGTAAPATTLPGTPQNAPMGAGAVPAGMGATGPSNTAGTAPQAPKPATGPNSALVQGGALGPQSAAQPHQGPVQQANAGSMDQNLQNYQVQMAQSQAPNAQPLPNNSGGMAGEAPQDAGAPNQRMAQLAAAAQLSQAAGSGAA